MFINLKLHTDYTLLEGVGKIEKYVSKAKNVGQLSIAITDKNLYSAIKAYNLCKKEKLNFILGIELYIYGMNLSGKFAITAYAIGDLGYKQLVRLATLSYSKKGILDILDLQGLDDLVIISGGINSEIYQSIIDLDFYNAKNTLMEYLNKFKNFYLELPCFSMPKQCLQKYVDYAKELNLELVATNDTYYVEKNEFILQKVVSAIRENKTINTVKNYYEPQDLYFKEEIEIRKNLNDIDPDIVDKAIENTKKISDLCIFNIKKRENNLPILDLPKKDTEYLKDLVYKNLEKKYSDNYLEAKKRADYELDIIDKMGFSTYFIIVYDIVKFANKNDILVGPGRGSAAGCIVSYLIGITNVDPIKYDLMFERFLNSGRKSMPDIDLDFETAKKDMVIQYVMKKYGKDHVANIITFSTMKEKQLKKDLNRVYKYNENQKLLKFLIEGLKDNVRHSSIHASGIIISKENLIDIVPVNRIESMNINISQYQMEQLESLGILKIDFLSLVNLDILSEVSKLTGINIYDINLDDKKTFDIYNKADTVGVFQVEASGMTKLIKEYKINNFSDISVVLALYRPGPLKSGMVNKLINIKNNAQKIEYLFPELEDILKSTYGVIIYQEQIMQIAKKIANFTLNESDDLRRAISKKKTDILEKYKEKFITSSVKNGYDEKSIKILYEQIEKFGEYGFNKSHTIPYAMLSYYTAYFKAHYRKEFVCALMNSQLGVHDKLESYYELLKNTDINLLPVDINKSNVNFIIENNNIRYSIYSVSEISKILANDIVEERLNNGLYKDILDFVCRMKNKGLTIKQFEILSKIGAFSEFNITRKELVENSKEIFELADKKQKSIDDVCHNLFFENTTKNIKYESKSIKEYSIATILEFEKKLLGIMLSMPKNDITFVITNKHSYDDQYIFYVKNIWVNLNDIHKLKSSTVNILIDNLSETKKDELKHLIKTKGGYAKVKFYENKKILKMKKPIYFDITEQNILDLINLVGKNNIKIFLD